MKATYLAAAIAAAVGMSGTAHAAFDLSVAGTLGGQDLGPMPTAVNTSGDYNPTLVGNVPPSGSLTARTPYEGLSQENTAEYSAVQVDSYASFNQSGSFLQILWGSPDDEGNNNVFSNQGDVGPSRNYIQFYDAPGGVEGGGAVVDTVTAADLKSEGIFGTATFTSDASSGALGYAWVKIAQTDGDTFESYTVFNEGGNAFEIDGAVVPLPAAAWLMIGGLGAIGAYARRARKAAPTA